MTEASVQPLQPRFMREAPSPVIPPALDAAVTGAVGASPALKDVRMEAAAAFRKAGLPTSHTEEFSFLRVAEFLPYLQSLPPIDPWQPPTAAQVQALVFPESRESYLVLVDGVYTPGISHPGPNFQVSLLEEALNPTSLAPLQPELRKSLILAAAAETDAAASLAMIFTAGPVLVQTVEKAVAKSPLQIIHFHRAAGSARPEWRRKDSWLVFRAARLSESRVTVRHVEYGAGRADAAAPAQAEVKTPGTLVNSHIHCILEAGASLKWLDAVSDPAAPAAGNPNFAKLTARVDRDARLAVTAASTGSRLTRNAFAIDLMAPGAEAELNGAAVLTDSRQNHNYVDIRHLAPNCSSRQHFKTVAANQAKSSVDGGIFVAEGAQLTNANQLINNLMLSDEARADSKPRLMIHADDVKCSHGATIGKLDEAQQFYLESRGLTAAQARTLLTVAFIDEIVERSSGVSGGTRSAGFHDYLERSMVDTLRKQATA